jgi:hypothetical protein
MINIQTVLTYLTLISVPIGVFYHILTLRNQTISRQIQIIRGSNVLGEYPVWILFNYDTSNLDEFISKFYEPDSEIRKPYFDWFNSLEELGMYLREGVLNIQYVFLLAGGSIITIWEKYEKIHMYFREIWGSRFLTEAEYLYKKLKEYVDKHPELAPD